MKNVNFNWGDDDSQCGVDRPHFDPEANESKEEQARRKAFEDSEDLHDAGGHPVMSLPF